MRGRTTGWRQQGRVWLAVILLFLAPLWLVVPRTQAIAHLVQSATPVISTSNTVLTVTATLPTAASAGNLLIVACSAGTTETISVTGYSTAAAPVSSTVSEGIFYKIATGGETTATCSFTSKTRNGLGILMYEYNNPSGATPIDVSSTANGTTAAVNSGSATPSTTSSLVFTALAAAGGTSFTGGTAGYTLRNDTSSTLHIAAADLFTTATSSTSYAATNSSAVAWRGQIAVFKMLPNALSMDIVDGSGNTVASPSVTMSTTTFSFSCQASTGTLGTSAQTIKVSNTTSTGGWALSIAPTSGATALWQDVSGHRIDVNDPSGGGCTDGTDADTYAGQLSSSFSGAAITPATGCTSTAVTLSAATSLSEGVVASLPLASATTSAPVDCSWKITGITLTQKIPAEQVAGSYSLSMTMTLVAQ